jgi:hypothetical protein
MYNTCCFVGHVEIGDLPLSPKALGTIGKLLTFDE